MKLKFSFPVRWSLWLIVFALLLSSCSGRKDVNRHGNIKLRGERPVQLKNKKPGDLIQKGEASWYGNPYHGRKTSNGETYDMNKLTAAHKTLPFNTHIKVVDPASGKGVNVRINDRGPFVKGRILDLSRESAKQLGLIGKGTAQVHLYLADGSRISDEIREELEEHSGTTRSGRGTGLPEVIEGEDLPDRRPNSREPHSEVLWTIQVGSFSSEGLAQAYAKKLDPYSNRIWIRKNKHLFRVRAGAFVLRSDAEEFANFLRSEGFSIWLTKFE